MRTNNHLPTFNETIKEKIVSCPDLLTNETISQDTKIDCTCPVCRRTHKQTIKRIRSNENTLCYSCLKTLDISGMRVNKLTAIELDRTRIRSGNAWWKCKCECGNNCVARSSSLINGQAMSCGCLRGRRSSGKNSNKATLEKWRHIVNKRDGGKCRVCGSTKMVQIHHLNNMRDHPNEATDPSNGICLCRKHHVEFHRWMGGSRIKCTKYDFLIWVNNRAVNKKLEPYRKLSEKIADLEKLDCFARQAGWTSWFDFQQNVLKETALIPHYIK